MVKVLLVDDLLLVRETLKQVLTDIDFIEVVGECSDGNEVVGFLDKHEVDVILMDINMKYVDGIEATTQVKDKHPSVKVVAFSMNDEDTFEKAMLKAGASAYLTKDVGFEQLLSVIRRVTDE